MAGSGRTKTSKTKHNSKVLAVAREYKRKDYKVKADGIKGFQKPPRRGGFIPDIIATKGNEEIIMEVETDDSVNSARDLSQQGAFQRAARRSGAKFKRIIAK